MTALATAAFIIDSVSGLRINNNKIAYCKDVFRIADCSGRRDAYDYSNPDDRF